MLVRPIRVMLLAAIALACCASALATGQAAAPAIKASAAVLTTADLPEAQVLSEDAGADSLVSIPLGQLPKVANNYTRAFSEVTFEGRELTLVTSAVIVAPSIASAHAVIAELDAPAIHHLLGTIPKSSATIKLIRFRKLHTGDETVEMTLALGTRGVSFRLATMLIRVGTVVESLTYLAQSSGLSAGQTTDLAKLAVARIKIASALPPTNTAVPTLTGTPALGQILTAQSGTWTGTSPAYTYQWLRCNSVGAACAAIIGSTQPTYTLSSIDQGQTVEVSVTDTNAAGAATANSLPSAPVS